MSAGDDEIRNMPLNDLVEEAFGASEDGRQLAGVELQRRTIISLDRAADESAQASSRLLVATWVLIALTVVLVGLTVAVVVLAIRA